jgi:peptide/nickel transport system substrate-binding protein
MNWGRYSNASVDKLVEQSLAAVDQEKREALAREAMGIAMRDHAAVLLHHQLASWAMRAELRYASRTDEYTLAHFFTRK